MVAFDRNGTVSDSYNGTHGWTVSSGNQYSAGGVPVFILETHGEVDGFVTVIEADGEVRGVIGMSSGQNLRNVENDGNLALFLLLSALAASTILVSRSSKQ